MRRCRAQLTTSCKLKLPDILKGKASRSRPALYKLRKQAKTQKTPQAIHLQLAAAQALPSSISSRTRPARSRDAHVYPATPWATRRGRGYKRYNFVERAKPGHEFPPAPCEFQRLTPIGVKRPLGAACTFRRNRRDVVSHRSAYLLSRDYTPVSVCNVGCLARAIGQRPP